MNINLLPNKFIRNRAFEVILSVSLLLSLVVVGVCGLGFWYYQRLVTNNQSNIMSSQAERIVFQRQLEEMLASKSQELQEFIALQKQEKYFTAPIMETFEEVASGIDVTINSYNLLLNGDAGTSETAQDGTPLFPLVNMAVQGDVYESLIRLKSAFEAIDWVHHVTYQSFSHSSIPQDGRITVYLSRIDAPQVISEDSEEESKVEADD
ncbi:hypothetical protein [Enterococcus casseliflavus]|uniref:hypothetical protein n=1 Tax=Enterococcus casseliflavus TaxID=37734 RepID=UPI000FF894F8|nr:hypothetical protein [Enterococcus casseliflavus]RXA70697.1 hypothetical protein EQ870_09675 [Enterococcus casseliflavus]